jgi:AcrR family transcriptional regulator
MARPCDETPTPRKTPREAQAAARREQFLDVALELFSKRGVRGTTVRDLAQAAGVTEGALYVYFPSKKALVSALIEQRNPGIRVRESIEQQHGVPIREALCNVGRCYLDEAFRNRRFLMLAMREAQEDRELAEELGSFIRQALEAGVGLFRERISTGELRPHDPEVSFRMLQGSLQAHFLQQTILTPPLPVRDSETYLQGVVDLLLQGISTEAREVAE